MTTIKESEALAQKLIDAAVAQGLTLAQAERIAEISIEISETVTPLVRRMVAAEIRAAGHANNCAVIQHKGDLDWNYICSCAMERDARIAEGS